MFEQVEYTQMKKGETYYIRFSQGPEYGYIITFVSLSNYISCKDVRLYDFKTKTITNLVTPYKEPCLFSKYAIYLRHITREEYMIKLNEIHQRNMTHKILQNILDDNFKYYL